MSPRAVNRSLEALQAILIEALPGVSEEVETVLLDLIRCEGEIGCTHLFAKRSGLKNRYRLARRLRLQGLPSLAELAGWIRLLSWSLRWEESHSSLFQIASGRMNEPATCYRLVRRLTRLGWVQVRALGSKWVLLRLLDRCHETTALKIRPETRPALPNAVSSPLNQSTHASTSRG